MTIRSIATGAGMLLAGLVGVLAGAGVAGADGYTAFRSPSGNIICAISTGDYSGVRCDMSSLTPSYNVPPPDCDLDWGASFAVNAIGGGYLACVGDAVADGSAPVLGYGKSISLDGFTCQSETSGMTCTNAAGHGFSIAKARQKLF